ncbi:MAG: hypothetical protein ACREBS_00450 [Nitrososphaerales archaeon]
MPLHYRTDPTNPWQPMENCLACGSRNIRIGCQYQDCEECNDVESSECLDCGCGFGGASYWKTITKRVVTLDGQRGEVSFEQLSGNEGRGENQA